VAQADSRVLGQTAIVIVLAAAVGLAACGRKGPLEAPPNAVTATAPQPEGVAVPPKPDKDFILDPLLD
jgi:predicted small lipoprotein YifL